MFHHRQLTVSRLSSQMITGDGIGAAAVDGPAARWMAWSLVGWMVVASYRVGAVNGRCWRRAWQHANWSGWDGSMCGNGGVFARGRRSTSACCRPHPAPAVSSGPETARMAARHVRRRSAARTSLMHIVRPAGRCTTAPHPPDGGLASASPQVLASSASRVASILRRSVGR